ncbi:MAG TPA: inorganic triphosphatase [Janthinobacterium sp.]|nr:inorganic triphosphatase [Janthinobacterium sp.]
MKSAAVPEHRETELKLLLPPDEAAALARHPLWQRYASSQPYRVDVTSHCYDTPELDIKRHGASLRVREADQQFFQSLKGGDGGAAGLTSRGEWGGPVAGPELDLPALRGMLGHNTRWNRLLRKRTVKRRLRPVFDTRISRTIWALRLPDGGEIELALDQGAIERDSMREPISEVELELKAGAPDKLYDFALQLLDTVPMRLGESSKAERGYALCLPFPQRHPALKAARVDLSDKMTVARGFRAIVGACLAHVQGNTAGVAEGGDVESVHQMRVGLRRLDSAFDLFKDKIAVPDALKGELDWLGGQLGAARDWEVLACSTLEGIEEGDVATLRAAVADTAREKHARAAEAVTSTRYAKAMLACAAWIEGETWCGERDRRRAGGARWRRR